MSPCWMQMLLKLLTYCSNLFFFTTSGLCKRFGSNCAPNLCAVPDHLCASLSNPSRAGRLPQCEFPDSREPGKFAPSSWATPHWHQTHPTAEMALTIHHLRPFRPSRLGSTVTIPARASGHFHSLNSIRPSVAPDPQTTQLLCGRPASPQHRLRDPNWYLNSSPATPRLRTT